jgi:hypothetical protein
MQKLIFNLVSGLGPECLLVLLQVQPAVNNNFQPVTIVTHLHSCLMAVGALKLLVVHQELCIVLESTWVLQKQKAGQGIVELEVDEQLCIVLKSTWGLQKQHASEGIVCQANLSPGRLRY